MTDTFENWLAPSDYTACPIRLAELANKFSAEQREAGKIELLEQLSMINFHNGGAVILSRDDIDDGFSCLFDHGGNDPRHSYCAVTPEMAIKYVDEQD